MFQKSPFTPTTLITKSQNSPKMLNIFRSHFNFCYYTGNCPFKVNSDLSQSSFFLAKLICGINFLLAVLKYFLKFVMQMKHAHGHDPVNYIQTLKYTISLWKISVFYHIIFKKGAEIKKNWTIWSICKEKIVGIWNPVGTGN